MASQAATSQETAVPQQSHSIFTGRRGRKLKEVLLAYLLLLPAFLIIFIFGIFPLAFSVYQSTLRGLNRIVGTYDGMGNYTRAMGNLAYIFGFWIAILFLYLAVKTTINLVNNFRENGDSPWLLAIPGFLISASFALFMRFLFLFLPLALGVAEMIRTAKQAGRPETTTELFREFLAEAWRVSEIQQAFWLPVGVFVIGSAAAYYLLHHLPHSRKNSGYLGSFMQLFIFLISGSYLAWYVWTKVQAAYAAAFADGESLEIWSQTISISAGLLLLLLSWFVWRSASHRDSNRSTFLRLAGGSLLIIGGWVLMAEIPLAAAGGDRNWYRGLLNTVFYSTGSIPFQFAISLMLATFLFQNIKGKSFFRMLFFLPYVTPAVGAAASFRILFSGRVDAPLNRILTSLGFEPLRWLNEPTGIVQMIIGDTIALPTWAAGPSLSLVVIIIFGIWTFVGFNTVIFLAGLGAIPGELYEAASIDGGGRWSQFRHITLPLLSPTIYFLTLYAVIGTFKAFNHIYVLRTSAALGTADTASLVIFDAMKRDTRYGYAAALAVLLLIIVMGLTIVNNRIASKKVFYG